MCRALIGLCLLLVLPLLAESATMYVATTGDNARSCATAQTLATPKQTIASGLACLSAGDTLAIRGGTYTEDIRSCCQTIPSGTSWSNPILITAYQSETVTINGRIDINTSGGGNFAYLIFNSLHFNLPDTIFFGGAGTHHIRLQNSEIMNSPHQGIQADGGPADLEFISLHVHNNGSTTSGGVAMDHGFYVAVPRVLIRDSDIHHNWGYGLQVYSTSGSTNDDARVYNNKVYNNGVGGGTGGVTFDYGNNMLFSNNLVYNNTGQGMQVCYGNRDNAQVYNNTFYGNSGEALSVCAGRTNTHITNNIVSNNGAQFINSGTSTTFASNLCGSGGTGCTLTGIPSFVNAGAADFHLTAGSLGRNVGTMLSAVPSDKDGVARPQGSAYDLGAYEFVETTSPITVYAAPTGLDSRTCATAQNIATPRQTLAGGLACLTAGGSTLYLRAGTYVEGIDTATQFVAGGASWSTPTTIAAYGGESVTLQQPIGTSVLVWLRNATQDHYILLDRLILDSQLLLNSNGLVFYPGTHHLRFQNGEIKNTYYESVYIYGANNTEILNSTLHDSTHEHGIHIVGTVDGTILQGNEVYASVGTGIRAVGSDAPIGTLTNTVIRNNKVHGNGGGSSLAAIAVGGTAATGTQVVNNVVYGNYAGIQVLSGASGAKVTNNTVANNTTVGLQIDAGASSTSVLNNISGGHVGGNLVNNGTGTATGTNLLSLPAFIDAPGGNYHLDATALTAIDAGTTAAEATTDYDGVTRPQNASYDIGAFEFVGVPGGPPPGVTLSVPSWQASGRFRR